MTIVKALVCLSVLVPEENRKLIGFVASLNEIAVYILFYFLQRWRGEER